jgi:hypothetical protein
MAKSTAATRGAGPPCARGERVPREGAPPGRKPRSRGVSQPVTAPSEALPTSLAYFASTPTV